MSITDSYDASTEAIISPRDVAPPVEGCPQTAVVCFNGRVMKALHEQYAPERFSAMAAGVLVPVYRVSYGGRDIAVYCSPVGGPAAASLLEEMISKGCGKFVFFGSCGALDGDIDANRLIVPTAAYRDEGTSYHYLPPGECEGYIEVESAGKLADILGELGLPYVLARTWTTDAVYRETRRNAALRRAEGCLAVEMECASVMAVARFRGVEAYQFLYAADSLDGESWDPRTLGTLQTGDLGRFLRIALEVAARV
jgi:uridine phosphorylase